eukprot:augustus_masked-scaffold_2-processed-gene-6.37-mRNA-1 protein AED:1.00 eAED:1.00 QI:0/-1/0/0/-1/1/1/0/996
MDNDTYYTGKSEDYETQLGQRFGEYADPSRAPPADYRPQRIVRPSPFPRDTSRENLEILVSSQENLEKERRVNTTQIRQMFDVRTSGLASIPQVNPRTTAGSKASSKRASSYPKNSGGTMYSENQMLMDKLQDLQQENEMLKSQMTGSVDNASVGRMTQRTENTQFSAASKGRSQAPVSMMMKTNTFENALKQNANGLNKVSTPSARETRTPSERASTYKEEVETFLDSDEEEGYDPVARAKTFGRKGDPFAAMLSAVPQLEGTAKQQRVVSRAPRVQSAIYKPQYSMANNGNIEAAPDIEVVRTSKNRPLTGLDERTQSAVMSYRQMFSGGAQEEVVRKSRNPGAARDTGGTEDEVDMNNLDSLFKPPPKIDLITGKPQVENGRSRTSGASSQAESIPSILVSPGPKNMQVSNIMENINYNSNMPRMNAKTERMSQVSEFSRMSSVSSGSVSSATSKESASDEDGYSVGRSLHSGSGAKSAPGSRFNAGNVTQRISQVSGFSDASSAASSLSSASSASSGGDGYARGMSVQSSVAEKSKAFGGSINKQSSANMGRISAFSGSSRGSSVSSASSAFSDVDGYERGMSYQSSMASVNTKPKSNVPSAVRAVTQRMSQVSGFSDASSAASSLSSASSASSGGDGYARGMSYQSSSASVKSKAKSKAAAPVRGVTERMSQVSGFSNASSLSSASSASSAMSEEDGYEKGMSLNSSRNTANTRKSKQPKGAANPRGLARKSKNKALPLLPGNNVTQRFSQNPALLQRGTRNTKAKLLPLLPGNDVKQRLSQNPGLFGRQSVAAKSVNAKPNSRATTNSVASKASGFSRSSTSDSSTLVLSKAGDNAYSRMGTQQSGNSYASSKSGSTKASRAFSRQTTNKSKANPAVGGGQRASAVSAWSGYSSLSSGSSGSSLPSAGDRLSSASSASSGSYYSNSTDASDVSSIPSAPAQDFQQQPSVLKSTNLVPSPRYSAVTRGTGQSSVDDEVATEIMGLTKGRGN